MLFFKRSCLLLLLLSVWLPCQAQNFLSLPGVRARAMGGAFVGLANDASAVWYNPAGIATPGRDTIVEWSEAVGVAEVDIVQDSFINGGMLDLEAFRDFADSGLIDQFNYEVNRATPFVSLKWESNVGYAIGVYFARPYTFDWFYLPDLEADADVSYRTIFGKLKQDLNLFGIAPAFAFADGRFKLGATLEYVSVRYSDSNFYLLDLTPDDTSWSRVNVSEAKLSSGLSYSTGTLIELLPDEVSKAKGVWLRIGATYRAKSDPKLEEDAENPRSLLLNNLLLQKPKSWEIGMSFTKAFTHKSQRGSTFTLAGQTGTTDFQASNDAFSLEYVTHNLGLEYVYSLNTGRHLALRGGTYTSKTDGEDWPDISATTAGIEAKLGDKFSISFTHEIRTYKDTIRLEGEDLGLSSAALNYSF